MKDFLKVFLRGIIVTILLPVIVLFLALYTVYLTIVYLIMLIRNLIVFFMGGSISDVKADIEAKKILKNQKNVETDMTKVLTDIMHTAIVQNPEAVQAMAQQQILANKVQHNRPANENNVVENVPASDIKEIETKGENE